MWKRVLAGTVAAAALAVTSAVGGQTAHAAQEDCPDGAVCFYTETDFRGKQSVHPNPGMNCDPAPNGTALSVINLTDREILLFLDPWCKAPFDAIEPSGYRPTVDEPVRSWV